MKNDEKLEMLGTLIDAVEDFLESKGITIENSERDEDDSDNTAIIYGSDYDYLSGLFEETLVNYGLLK